jgi:hypothetical protein
MVSDNNNIPVDRIKTFNSHGDFSAVRIEGSVAETPGSANYASHEYPGLCPSLQYCPP